MVLKIFSSELKRFQICALRLQLVGIYSIMVFSLLKILPVLTVSGLLLCPMNYGFASNILFVPAMGEGSRLSVMTAIAKEMVNRGHNTTFLVASHFKEAIEQREKPHQVETFTPVISKEFMDELIENMTRTGLRGEKLQSSGGFDDYYSKLVEECRSILADQDLMTRLMDSNYTLSVTETGLMCPVVQYLKEYSSVPFVGVSPWALQTGAEYLLIRSPFNPSYMPEFTSELDHVMSFMERLTNTVSFLFFTFAMRSFVDPYDDIKSDYNIPGNTQTVADAELLLINTNFALDFPRPFLANNIMVGGLTLKPLQALDKVSF